MHCSVTFSCRVGRQANVPVRERVDSISVHVSLVIISTESPFFLDHCAHFMLLGCTNGALLDSVSFEFLRWRALRDGRQIFVVFIVVITTSTANNFHVFTLVVTLEYS